MDAVASALVTVSLGRLSPRASGVMEPLRASFQCAVADEVDFMYKRFEDWQLAKLLVLLRAAQFRARARDLREHALPKHAGEGRCAVCQEPAPDSALECCGGGIHHACWVAWQLSEPKGGCLLCRTSV